jgi:hypothetical protein
MDRRIVKVASLGAVGALILTLSIAPPAFAGYASGYRSCNTPKSVTLTSVFSGSYGYHSYGGAIQYIYNPDPGMYWSKQTYSAMKAGNWAIYANSPLAYYTASCI